MSAMATTNTPPIRLLIVDDDDQLRQTLARRFQRQGMEVTAAGGAEEVLAKPDQSRWDVALLDLHLPGNDRVL
jgi:ActR/RegA family two-component response regulator